MALPNELVRARIGGVEKNLGRAYAESTEGVEILADESVRNPDGSLRGTTLRGGRPLKERSTVAREAAKKTAKKAAKKRPAKKAAAKKSAAKTTASPPTPAAEDAAGQQAVTTSADDKKEQDQ